ncbi:MAG: hypothetical protein JO316_11975 [Abitibacteriaceae bacterium]|nr:hypothetical protein [Abditibacteriaceae bacterium]MBV9866061.1 hypothetical protein [Abditibacteriaceae bacterium]
MNDEAQTPTDTSSGNSSDAEVIVPPAATRDADSSETLPPLSIRGKGPMDQSVPDVATGSTPATRHDD